MTSEEPAVRNIPTRQGSMQIISEDRGETIGDLVDRDNPMEYRDGFSILNLSKDHQDRSQIDDVDPRLHKNKVVEEKRLMHSSLLFFKKQLREG